MVQDYQPDDLEIYFGLVRIGLYWFNLVLFPVHITCFNAPFPNKCNTNYYASYRLCSQLASPRTQNLKTKRHIHNNGLLADFYNGRNDQFLKYGGVNSIIETKLTLARVNHRLFITSITRYIRLMKSLITDKEQPFPCRIS